MDIGSITFSTGSIMGTYYILSVFLIGYFLYILFFKKRNETVQTRTGNIVRTVELKEIEVFILILSLGILSIVILNFWLVFSKTKELFMGRFYQAIIGFSALSVFLCSIFKERIPNNNCNRIFLSSILLVVLPIVIICIFQLVGFRDVCEPLKTPFVTYENLTTTGLTPSEYCNYECYVSFGSMNAKLLENNSTFYCLCNISNCKFD